MNTKKCYGCKRELPIENFTKNKNTKDGFSYYCRDCTKKNYTLNKYKHSNNQDEYESVIIDELKKHNITISGVNKEKINNLVVTMIDFPGAIRPLLKDLPIFCKKYNLTYEEYKCFIKACNANKFWIKPKDLNTMEDNINIDTKKG